jgi:hypothetical protein
MVQFHIRMSRFELPQRYYSQYLPEDYGDEDMSDEITIHDAWERLNDMYNQSQLTSDPITEEEKREYIERFYTARQNRIKEGGYVLALTLDLFPDTAKPGTAEYLDIIENMTLPVGDAVFNDIYVLRVPKNVRLEVYKQIGNIRAAFTEQDVFDPKGTEAKSLSLAEAQHLCRQVYKEHLEET